MKSKFTHAIVVAVVSDLLGCGLTAFLISAFDVNASTALAVGIIVGLLLSSLEPWFRE